MKNTNTQSQTAKEAYEQKLAAIELRIAQLTEGLKAAKAKDAPNWGDVGSLNHLEELLTQALAFQRGCEPEEVR